MHQIPGGLAHLPIPVALIFAAPIAALLFSFFVVRPSRPRLTHVPILYRRLPVPIRTGPRDESLEVVAVPGVRQEPLEVEGHR